MARATADVGLPPPLHVYQLDGSAWGGSGCMGAVGAMALDAYTRGAIRVGMHRIRDEQDDKAGGIGLDDVATAWHRGWGLTFTHGSPSWPAIMDRLRRRQGVAITANYRALGRHRAPGSSFGGAHALYLQAAGSAGIVVNDPLRRGPVTLPEAAVRLAYTGGAGWGKGTYGGSSGESAGDLAAWGGLVSFRDGHVLTEADVALIMDRLKAAGWFAGDTADPLNVGDGFEGSAAKTARAILRRYVGRTWSRATLAALQAEFGVAAVGAGNLGGLGDSLAGLVPVLDELPARAGIVVGAVALGVLGVWLTFREPSTVVLPSPVRRIARR